MPLPLPPIRERDWQSAFHDQRTRVAKLAKSFGPLTFDPKVKATVATPVGFRLPLPPNERGTLWPVRISSLQRNEPTGAAETVGATLGDNPKSRCRDSPVKPEARTKAAGPLA